MSETERNEAGQFTADVDTTGLYGQQALEAEAGYKPMTLANPVKDAPDDFSLSEAEGADAYASAGEEEPVIPIEYLDVRTGEPRDPRETVTLEQAAHDYDNWTNSNADDASKSISRDLAAEVEILRALDAKVVEGDDVGELATEKDAAAEARKASVEKVAKQVVDEATWDGTGLSPKAQAALADPQIRQAIESEVAETHQVREQYSTALQHGQQMMQATVATLAPQLQNLPLEQWPAAIQQMAQTDPFRAQMVAETLQKWGTIQQASQQDQQQKAAVAKQQFETWSAQEDQKFEAMLPGEDRSPAGRQAVASELFEYMGELGVSPGELVKGFKEIPLLRSALGQKILFDAVKARQAHKAVQTYRSKASRTIPTVQRPGVAGAARQSNPDAELESQFAKNPTLKNAQRLYTARSNRKG